MQGKGTGNLDGERLFADLSDRHFPYERKGSFEICGPVPPTAKKNSQFGGSAPERGISHPRKMFFQRQDLFDPADYFFISGDKPSC
jgi:hypothetical protein